MDKTFFLKFFMIFTGFLLKQNGSSLQSSCLSQGSFMYPQFATKSPFFCRFYFRQRDTLRFSSLRRNLHHFLMFPYYFLQNHHKNRVLISKKTNQKRRFSQASLDANFSPAKPFATDRKWK